MELPDKATIGQIYGPAMEITDPEKAREYFEALVARMMRLRNCSREEAERIERSNLGYYAGYYDPETASRVLGLFGAAHPIFGTAAPTAEQAFAAGAAKARS